MEQKIKINQIVSLTQKSKFGDGKYFGYRKEKFLGIIKITTNKKIIGYGETLVGVYSPKLFKIICLAALNTPASMSWVVVTVSM